MSKKRILVTAISVICSVVLLLGTVIGIWNHAKTQSGMKQYALAVKTLQEESVKPDGSYQVSEALITALRNATYTQPKNIILMIGDGMGITAVEAARRVYRDCLYDGMLAMNYMPVQSSQATYSAGNDVTDSAAGATALATGYKTTNKIVGMDFMGQVPYTTLLEIAAARGMATGIVSNEDITDATPAAFTAHVPVRYNQKDIAAMQLQMLADGTLDLVLGGGYGFYEAEPNADVLMQVQNAGVTYSRSWDEIQSASLPFCGLFAETFIETRDETLPQITQLTDLALRQLDEAPNGFFLMVEGAHIDTYGEAMNFERTVEEVYAFDCAVAIAMRYVAMHPDTVLVVTADHETGGLWIPAEETNENKTEHTFESRQHSSRKVPLYAVGYNTQTLVGLQENTDVAIFLASLMGEEEFGQKSTILSKDNDEIQVTFSKEQSAYVMDEKYMPSVDKSMGIVTMFHITMENPGDTPSALPELVFGVGKRTYEAVPQVHYLDAGEKMVVSYTVPYELRAYRQYSKVQSVYLALEEDARMVISDIQITTRPAGK